MRVLVGGLVAMAVVVARAPADVPVPVTQANPAGQAACPGAGLTLLSQSSTAVEQAVLCLVNDYRQREGRALLKISGSLRNAAREHANKMVTQHFFSHTDPDGATLTTRLLEHHYVTRRTRRWIAAENIGIAGGVLATPQHVVSDWMASPQHRANLLRTGLKEIGVAAVAGAPESLGANPVTVVMDLGSRR